MLIFAVESSCDETSLCLMRSNGSILSHIIASQEIHSKFGGVVPELASRSHLSNIQQIYKNCLIEAKITEKDIDACCATIGPGLIGSLLVGSTFVKSLSMTLNKPFYPINHLEGHILSPTFNNKVKFPYLCFLLTGGHTQIYLVNSIGKYKLLGETIDDAVGEAFDKVAKLLDLPYPGGPSIEYSAKTGDINAVNLPHPLKKYKNLNFSFSGIKTSVNLHIKKNGMNKNLVKNISASFQNKISEILIEKLNLCLQELKNNNVYVNDLALVGGVAANKFLRLKIKNECTKKNINLIVPPKKMFGDNAGMIAWACIQKLKHSKIKNDLYFRPNPRLEIENKL